MTDSVGNTTFVTKKDMGEREKELQSYASPSDDAYIPALRL